MSSAQSIVVKHNGKAYENFSRLYIRLGLDEICQYLEMDVSKAQTVHKHDTLKVLYAIDGFERLVATVRVDAISRLLNSNSQSYRISGRSAARNIVDSSYSEQWRGLRLYEIVQRIARRFGIATANYAGRTDVIEQFEFEAESPWQKLQTAASAQGCVLYSSQSGGLYLNTVAATQRPEPFSLVQNRNIEEISIEEDGSGQFYRYEVVGERGVGVAIDESCKDTKRIMSVNMSDSTMSLKELRRWARVQMQRRRSNTIKVRLLGWGLDKQGLDVVRDMAAQKHADEKKRKLYGFETLWQPNMYVPIRLDAYKIGTERPEYRLVSSVEYAVEADSISCNVSLKPREDYL